MGSALLDALLVLLATSTACLATWGFREQRRQ